MNYTLLDREVESDSKFSQIGFFGGEPLLKKDLIYRVVEYADSLEKNNDIKFSYTITTNATLIDREFINLAKGHNFLIGLSIDGTEEVHNRKRFSYSGESIFNEVVDIAKTSPLVCETERIFINISDRLAERLYKEGNTKFYGKKYFFI